MQLNKFQAVAKKRGGWEAIDLGCVMARVWFFKLWLVWLIPAAVCLLIASIIFHREPMYASLVTWLLKPVWERPLLFVASQQLFGEKLSYSRIFKHFISCNKKDWFWWLTIRRFSPNRAYLMPVTVLEGLAGKARRSRTSLLLARFANPASWLLISAVHIEFFLLLALATGLALLIPTGVELQWESIFFEHTTMATHFYNVGWLLMASFIAPFYVCGGFALYLQRRIDLEAWDIEIQFRELSARLKKKISSRLADQSSALSLLLCLVCACCLMSTSPSATAQDADTESSFTREIDELDREFSDDQEPSRERDEIKKQAQAILSEAPFYHFRIEKTLLPKPPKEEKPETPGWLNSLINWLDGRDGSLSSFGKLVSNIALLVEILFWASVVLLIGFVLFHFRGWIKRSLGVFGTADKNTEPTAPQTLFGIVLEGEPLPDDIVAKAQSLWRQNQAREAFALLLRATLLVCVERGCKFKDGYTESECADIVKRQFDATQSASFKTLIDHWQKLAYAHRSCGDDVFHLLCTNYTEYWGK